MKTFANLSSYDALVARVALPVEKTQKKEKDFTSTYTPFIVPKPKWNESGLIQYQKETAKKLKDLSVEFNQPEFIPVLCELFSKILVISAERNFETTKPKPNTSKNNNKQMTNT